MQIPRRMVSLSPNVSMMLFALDADAAVVGRTQECLPAIQQYLTVWRIPEHAVAQRLQHWQALPVVGAWPLADRESIKALHLRVGAVRRPRCPDVWCGGRGVVPL